MREKGFYWTRMSGAWIVSAWIGDEWKVPGQYHPAFDIDFEVIDERQILRIEQHGNNTGTGQRGETTIDS